MGSVYEELVKKESYRLLKDFTYVIDKPEPLSTTSNAPEQTGMLFEDDDAEIEEIVEKEDVCFSYYYI